MANQHGSHSAIMVLTASQAEFASRWDETRGFAPR